MKSSADILAGLFKKKSALFGLLFIIFSSVISIFAFFIIPDNTINANEQISELALKAPGFKIKVLKKPRLNQSDRSIISKLFMGDVSSVEYIPYTDIRSDSDYIYLESPSGIQKIISLNEFSEKEGEAVIENHTEEKRFWFGTDKFGRDMLSRIILGLRISLLVGFLAVLISLTIGVSIGLISGYFGGWLDDIVMWLINTVWSIPTVLLVFAIVIAMGRSVYVIFLAVGLTLWVDVARLIRGQVKEIKSKAFLDAAKTMGFKSGRIMFVHILPNLTGPLMVIAASNFAIAILIEAGLSYLGFGVQPPTPSLGNMLYENYGFAISGKVFVALVPAIVIMLLVLSFNLTGNGLRDILDVKESK